MSLLKCVLVTLNPPQQPPTGTRMGEGLVRDQSAKYLPSVSRSPLQSFSHLHMHTLYQCKSTSLLVA